MVRKNSEKRSNAQCKVGFLEKYKDLGANSIGHSENRKTADRFQFFKSRLPAELDIYGHISLINSSSAAVRGNTRNVSGGYYYITGRNLAGEAILKEIYLDPEGENIVKLDNSFEPPAERLLSRWAVASTSSTSANLFLDISVLAQLGHLPKYTDENSKAWHYGKLFVALIVEKLICQTNPISPWSKYLFSRY